MKMMEVRAPMMDGNKILHFIFDEFSEGDIDTIRELFENGAGYGKINTEEDEKELCKIRTMNFPKWSIKFQENFGPPKNDYIFSGDSNSEDMSFSGDVVEFKIWLKKNRLKWIKAFNLSADKIKKLDAIVKE